MQKILILGIIPPPVGGVTMHIKRLLERLEKSDIPFLFVDINRTKWNKVWLHIKKAEIIHLNISSPFMQFFLSLFSFFLKKKLIITFHGEVHRHNMLPNFLQTLSIKLCRVPVVLNKKSMAIASKYNDNTKLISAFIPPVIIEGLSNDILVKIALIKKESKTIFCTNAYDVAFDRSKREIYQISPLIELFNGLADKGLIISDPSGKYSAWLAGKGITLNKNILILSFLHDFNAVIQECDCVIRFTTTDGDSLSVKEALWAGKSVIASNVVDRPDRVILVNDDINELKKVIIAYIPGNSKKYMDNAFDDLYKIYKNILVS